MPGRWGKLICYYCFKGQVPRSTGRKINRREETTIGKRTRRRAKGEGSIYRRKDGRWAAEWTAQTLNGPRRRTVYGKTQTEAIQKRKDEMAEERGGMASDAGRITVGEYLGWWMENVVENDVAHRTFHNYQSQIRNHILPALGKKKLRTLKLEDVEGLYRSMAASGLSSATVRYVHAVLRRALKQAVVRGLVPHNAAEGASLPRTGKQEIRPLSPDEVRRFLAAARGDRLEALFVVAVTCGLRQGELVGLRWGDIDLEARRLTVRRQLQRSKDGSGLVFSPTKNKKNRAIRLGNHGIEVLKAHRRRQSEEKRLAKGLHPESDLVFVTTQGTPLDPPNLVARSFKPLLRRAGLPDIRFHDLRHVCATLLLSQGVSVKVVQEVLGHSSVSVTMDVYSHVLPDMQEKAAAAMDGQLSDDR